MADNKHEAKKVRRECINRQKKTRESSGRSWTEGNKNKPDIRIQYSPPVNRQNRHYANGRADIILCKNTNIREFEEESRTIYSDEILECEISANEE